MKLYNSGMLRLTNPKFNTLILTVPQVLNLSISSKMSLQTSTENPSGNWKNPSPPAIADCGSIRLMHCNRWKVGVDEAFRISRRKSSRQTDGDANWTNWRRRAVATSAILSCVNSDAVPKGSETSISSFPVSIYVFIKTCTAEKKNTTDSNLKIEFSFYKEVRNVCVNGSRWRQVQRQFDNFTKRITFFNIRTTQ